MLKFYDIDANYIRFLQTIDSRIPNISSTNHSKFVCGIVLKINSVDYYAPISSNTKQMYTSFIIKNISNEAKSSIRFSFMFPCHDNYIAQKDFDKEQDKSYQRLLYQEYDYCQQHEQKILSKAAKIYRVGCDKNHKLNYTCCDFKLLEQRYMEFIKPPIEKDFER